MEHSHKPNKLTDFLERSIRNTKPMQEKLEPKNEVCPEHGQYISNGARYMGNREIWSKCPDCVENKLANERQAEAEKKAKEMKAQLESQIEQSAIPLRFVSRTFENFTTSNENQAKALAVASNYAIDFNNHLKKGEGLVLSGLPGTGKSHLATAILQAIMPNHVGLYITCMSLIRAVRGTWRKESELSEVDILDTFCKVPLLVIDEIGVQYGTDGEQTILFDVLDRRYRDMMPTILLTNQDKKGFKEFIGERSFDRLVESSRWVAFDWGSYRPQARIEHSSI